MSLEPVQCTTCGKNKKPLGRDYAGAGYVYCDEICPGYREDPQPPIDSTIARERQEQFGGSGMPAGPYSLGSEGGIYAGGDSVYVGEVSTEDLTEDQALAVQQRWRDALSWTEPLVLDAPDGRGWWWHRYDHSHSKWTLRMVYSPGKRLVTTIGGPCIDTKTMGGLWVRLPSGPGLGGGVDIVPAAAQREIDNYRFEVARLQKGVSQLILEAPDEPGVYWYRRSPTDKWDLTPWRVASAEGGLQVNVNGIWGWVSEMPGQWTKVLPPGPTPAIEDGKQERLRDDRDALLAACKVIVARLDSAARCPFCNALWCHGREHAADCLLAHIHAAIARPRDE